MAYKFISHHDGVMFTVLKKSLKIAKGGNQNPQFEEQTTQWPKEKVQKYKQRSTKQYTEN
jgi:hypothetical protein